MPSSNSERRLAAQLGGLARSAQAESGTAMTEQARRTFRDSFDTGHKCRLCPETVIDPVLPAAERRRKAEAAYRAHMTRLSHRRSVMTRKVVEAGQELAQIEGELQRLDDAV